MGGNPEEISCPFRADIDLVQVLVRECSPEERVVLREQMMLLPNVCHVNVVLADADDVAHGNQNNNALTQRAGFTDSDSDQDTDSDGDGLMDSRASQDMMESSLKSHPSDTFKANDRSPRRKKKKKSLERLTQIRQEEVNSEYLLTYFTVFQCSVFLLESCCIHI